MVTTSANLLGINRHRARLLIVLDHQRSNSLVLLEKRNRTLLDKVSKNWAKVRKTVGT